MTAAARPHLTAFARDYRQIPLRIHNANTCSLCMSWSAERWLRDTAIGRHDNEDGPPLPWLHGGSR